MARTPKAGYKGSLKLNYVEGLRADKKTYQPIKVKPADKLPSTPPARKTATTGRFK